MNQLIQYESSDVVTYSSQKCGSFANFNIRKIMNYKCKLGSICLSVDFYMLPIKVSQLLGPARPGLTHPGCAHVSLTIFNTCFGLPTINKAAFIGLVV